MSLIGLILHSGIFDVAYLIIIRIFNNYNSHNIAIKIIIVMYMQTDRAIVNEGAVLKINLPAKRLVYVPVNINQEYDDVRSFGESAKKAVLRSVS